MTVVMSSGIFNKYQIVLCAWPASPSFPRDAGDCVGDRAVDLAAQRDDLAVPAQGAMEVFVLDVLPDRVHHVEIRVGGPQGQKVVLATPVIPPDDEVNHVLVERHREAGVVQSG